VKIKKNYRKGKDKKEPERRQRKKSDLFEDRKRIKTWGKSKGRRGRRENCILNTENWCGCSDPYLQSQLWEAETGRPQSPHQPVPYGESLSHKKEKEKNKERKPRTKTKHVKEIRP
jgi:hypothetical protein